uniref:Uncharacterized protein n=1 Tax=Anguilla anguilla TaxID=7936 RepID=A0A0E9TVH3_ANGAN
MMLVGSKEFLWRETLVSPLLIYSFIKWLANYISCVITNC